MMKTFNCGIGFCLIVERKFKKNKNVFSKKFEPYKMDLFQKQIKKQF